MFAVFDPRSGSRGQASSTIYVGASLMRRDNLFRSTDGGRIWKPVFGGGGTYDFSLAPYVSATPIHWLFDIEIDPADSDHAMFTTGYGGYETFNLRAVDAGRPTRWSVMSTGIEETVALDLLSPQQGAHLLTAVGDYGGFVHWDLDKPVIRSSTAEFMSARMDAERSTATR